MRSVWRSMFCLRMESSFVAAPNILYLLPGTLARYQHQHWRYQSYTSYAGREANTVVKVRQENIHSSGDLLVYGARRSCCDRLSSSSASAGACCLFVVAPDTKVNPGSVFLCSLKVESWIFAYGFWTWILNVGKILPKTAPGEGIPSTCPECSVLW